MNIDQTELQSLVLEVLTEPRSDTRLGRGQHYLTEAIRNKAKNRHIPSNQIMAMIWSLVAQGLAYIDFSQHAPENWQLLLTASGNAAVNDNEINPNNSEKYISRISERIPDLPDYIRLYITESLVSFNNRCYLASAVMLGVASEAAFLEMASSFIKWLPAENERNNFENIINNNKKNYIDKFNEFRKRLQTHISQLPNELSDNITLSMDAILDLLRIYRNDSGHPTGKIILRDDAFINLQMFARYLEKLYKFKTYFENN